VTLKNDWLILGDGQKRDPVSLGKSIGLALGMFKRLPSAKNTQPTTQLRPNLIPLSLIAPHPKLNSNRRITLILGHCHFSYPS